MNSLVDPSRGFLSYSPSFARDDFGLLVGDRYVAQRGNEDDVRLTPASRSTSLALIQEHASIHAFSGALESGRGIRDTV
jgi:hypothetical protein